MRYRIKFIFTRLSLLSVPLALIGSVVYFNIDYSFSKAFQLGTLIAMAALLSSAIFFTLLYMLLYPILAGFDRKDNEIHHKRPKRKRQFSNSFNMDVNRDIKTKNKIETETESVENISPNVKLESRPKDEKISHQTKKVDKPTEVKTKEAIKKPEKKIEQKRKNEEIKKPKTKKSDKKKSEDVTETKKILKELSQSGGLNDEIMVILPFELSFLFAKESLKSLSFGKIKEEDEETGIIVGTAGFGSSPQYVKLTVRRSTKHSTVIEILSRSNTSKQSDKKNRSYIDKMFSFIRSKEEFYTNED